VVPNAAQAVVDPAELAVSRRLDWRVAGSGSAWAIPGLALWAWQIVMNALWSPIFFGLHRLGGALVALIGLWIAVALTTAVFFLADPVAGALMVPYVVWVTIAGALNFALWRMNPEVPSAGLARA
jgi:benzodiazapine receptor